MRKLPSGGLPVSKEGEKKKSIAEDFFLDSEHKGISGIRKHLKITQML